jgi:hypothetical protein
MMKKLKGLTIGSVKDKELIIKVERHLNRVDGVGWILLERYPNNGGKIGWFKGHCKGKKIYIKRIR